MNCNYQGRKQGENISEAERNKNHGFHCKRQCKKPVLCHQDKISIRGAAREGHQKDVQCVHLELSELAKTMEQKVRKPVLSRLSCTLPRPREEAKETGGGAGCYRIRGILDGP